MDGTPGEIVVVDYNTKILSFDFLAQFAVDEHNKKNSSALRFVKGLKAMEQKVAGTTYYIILEAKDGSGKQNTYRAGVWFKLNNTLELVEFKHFVDVASSA